ncbi:MAG TPA: ribose-5-phosphate isomerase RpiA [Solirubrobacteraceae bacterium]|nr:ribose-5-phosphate isomerase RpiA [Solirubrobacteraceae bacterium]
MSAGDEGKRAAAEQAAALVEPGMRVGLGTGSTVNFLLPALAARGLEYLRCVATSDATERQARELGLPVEPFDRLERLDLAIDGADEVAPDRWLIKGGGGAHTREKIVATAAERFVVIVDESKTVDALSWPGPLELLPFGLAATLARLGPEARLREGAAPSPDGGVIADVRADLSDPRALAEQLDATPGVVDHGLFPPELVADVIVGRAG